MELSPGSLISNRYQVVRVVGKGSQGMVYECKDQKLGGLKVALKAFPAITISSGSRQKQLNRELSAALRVDHDNVVKLYDLLYSKKLVAIVMEYVDGETLFQLLQKEPQLEISRIVSLLRQISLGLQQIHSKEILHRDLKPENILISSDNRAKLADFGISTIREDIDKQRREGQGAGLIGTPYFLPPEYFEKKIFDERSDIYALGLIMFETITGRQAFKEKDTQKLYREKITRGVLPPKHFRDDCPEALSALCVRCVATDPNLRPESMNKVLQELNDLILNAPAASSALDISGALSASEAELSRARYGKFLKSLSDPSSESFLLLAKWILSIVIFFAMIGFLRALPILIEALEA